MNCISELRESYFMINHIFERFTSWLIDSDKNIFLKRIFQKVIFVWKNEKNRFFRWKICKGKWKIPLKKSRFFGKTMIFQKNHFFKEQSVLKKKVLKFKIYQNRFVCSWNVQKWGLKLYNSAGDRRYISIQLVILGYFRLFR